MNPSIIVLAAALLAASPALADEAGAPAAPSGAPAAAAQHGSSDAGVAASKNEMRSHDQNEAAQKMMDDPHKQDH